MVISDVCLRIFIIDIRVMMQEDQDSYLARAATDTTRRHHESLDLHLAQVSTTPCHALDNLDLTQVILLCLVLLLPASALLFALILQSCRLRARATSDKQGGGAPQMAKGEKLNHLLAGLIPTNTPLHDLGSYMAIQIVSRQCDMLSVENAEKPHKIVEVHCDSVGRALRKAGANLTA